MQSNKDQGMNNSLIMYIETNVFYIINNKICKYDLPTFQNDKIKNNFGIKIIMIM